MVFLLSADGEHLELPQGCQGAFRGSGRKVGLLSGPNSGKGPQLALRGESPGFSRVAAGFLSSYNRDIRDPLVGPQGVPVSTRVVRGPLVFLCSHCWGRGPHLELRPEPQVSSPWPTWISGSSGVSTRESALISCGARLVCSTLEPEKQCQASCRVDNKYQWISLEAPQGCHTCHRVLSRSSG